MQKLRGNSEYQRRAAFLVYLFHFIAFHCDAQTPAAESKSAFYDLPRDCEVLKRLQYNSATPAIVIRGFYNTSATCQFVVRTSNRQLAVQVTKLENPFCVGRLQYFDAAASDSDSDQQCVKDLRELPSFSSRSQVSVFISSEVSNQSYAAQSRLVFSFELAFTFYRTYTTACDALKCSDARWCLPVSLRCDGIPNCEDGSDEAEDLCRESYSAAAFSSIFGEYMTHLMAAVLALALISVAVGVGVYCRRHQRLLREHRQRVLELARRAEYARAAAHLSDNRTSSGNDTNELVVPFLSPPDYNTVVMGDCFSNEMPPPSYADALEIAKLNVEFVENVPTSSAENFDSPSTSSCRIGETEPAPSSAAIGASETNQPARVGESESPELELGSASNNKPEPQLSQPKPN